MMTKILSGLKDLHFETALLEAFNWDEEKKNEFHEEFKIMMLAAPLNVDKALFFLRNIKWNCLGGEQLPKNVYNIIEDHIIKVRDRILQESEDLKSGLIPLPHFRKNKNTDPEEWN